MTGQDGPPVDELASAQWQISSHSGSSSSCVAVARLADGRMAIRNSNHPERGVVLVRRTEFDAFIEGVKAGEFDLAPA